MRTPFGGSLMRMVTLSIPVVLALCLGAANLSAQQPGNGTFQWYVGGHGGILNFESSAQGRSTLPLGGAHLLITARRTGLLLSVEQGFGSNELGAYTMQAFDSVGTLVSEAEVATSFDYIRKYSAMLMAFPIRGPATPYFGIGVGVIHTGGHTPDDEFSKEMGSSAFGSLIGGLNFRGSRFSAFGQYQITTGPGMRRIDQTFSDDTSIAAFGSLLRGPTHTFSAGLRFNLGNAKERSVGGGY
ncbi:MAG: hypothetical protein M3Q37_09780 [Gemmatimonadota bacterium]|nr:hypothetical protein [Gemmatimonadota bacterium]